MQLVRQKEKFARVGQVVGRLVTTVRGASVLILVGVVGGACAQPSGRAGRGGPEAAPEPPAAVLGSAGAPVATYALEVAGHGAGSQGAHPAAPRRPAGESAGSDAARREAASGGAVRGEAALPAGAEPDVGADGQDLQGRPAHGTGSDGPDVAAEAPSAGRGFALNQAAVALGASPLPGQRYLSGSTLALTLYASRLASSEVVRAANARAWGLSRPPLIPPAPPAKRPLLRTERDLYVGRGLPPVITRVPTRDRVVFLTIDDGTEKDPGLVHMLGQLGVPVSAFLTDYLVRDDYGYFRGLQSLGTAIENHTLHHPDLRTLSYEQQREEICTQQDTIEREFGLRPRLFRPPYGGYDRDTLRAAQSCGITAVPLWSEEAFPGRLAYGWEHKLHPGDIILTHFRGRAEWGVTLPDVVRRVVRTATAQGFAVARLEDYL